MQRIVTKGFLFIVLFLGATWGLSAQSQLPYIDLTVRFDAGTNVYQVYAKADSTLNDFYMGGGSQVSLIVPSSIPDVTFNITSVVGGPWSDNSQIYAPSAQPGSDFHSITTNGTMPAQTYTTGTEVLLFTFTTPSGGCDGGIRLFRNNPENANPADPDSNAPGMLGGDFLNYLGEVNTGDNYYQANYDNNGTSCGGNPPNITDIIVVTDLPEDSTITVCTAFNDIDANDTFTPGLCSAPANGSASATILNGELCVTYTPSANFTGLDSVCVTVCDQTGNCDSTVVTFNVTPVNDPPIAQNENLTTPEDTPINVSLTVTDIDGPAENYSVILNPTNGTASINSSGVATYTPAMNFVGVDSFTYVVCDGGSPDLCDTAVVLITITNQNDPPVITAIGTTFTPEDSTVTSCTPFTDSDIGDTFTASFCGTPNNGTASVAIVNNELCVTYTPNSGFSGNDALCASVCDQMGNCDSVIFNIVVSADTTSISNACLTCPSGISVSATFGSCAASVPNLGQPSTTGNCTAAAVSNDAPALFPVGQTMVTWTLTASNGSTATCEQAVSVQDNQAPQITCPANLTFNTNSGACSAGVSNLGSPGTTDNCGIDTVTHNHPNSTYPVGLTNVTWTVVDLNGNTSTCQQSVLVRDNDAPSIVCPAPVNVTTDSTGCTATMAALGTPNATDNCGVTSVSNDHPSATYSIGTTTVVWTTSDATGNTASCTQEVTVTDGIAPSIVCPAPLVVDPASGSCTATVTNLGNASATDNCGTPAITNNATSTTFQSGVTSVIWSAEDAGGLVATCEQVVLVRDNQIPTITCPSDITVAMDPTNCFATVPNIGQAIGVDNCAIATVTNDHVSPIYPLGATSVIWTASDVASNSVSCVQVVTVEDTQAPAIVCPSNIDINTDAGNCTATIPNLGTATGTDNCTVSNVTNNQTTSTFPVGLTTVVWTVIDAGGNAITCAQEVRVTDNQAPSIACPVDVQVTAPNGTCNANVTGLGAPTTADNCGVASVSSNQVSSTYPVGSTTVLWTATDNDGNTATCAQNVVVTDGQIPTITCPTDIVVDADAGSCDATVPNLGLPTTADNCGIASTMSDASSTTFTAGTTTVLWTVTDNGGNTATCAQNVTVADNNAPSITCPNPLSVNADATMCSATIPNIGNPTATDNCGIASTTSDAPTSNIFAEGGNIVTWIASDNNGNTATCTQTITVTDNVAPSITCPTNITNVSADPNACSATITALGTPVTADNCTLGALTNDQGTNNSYPTGTSTVVWTILDATGNSATCTQTISVSENEAPTIVCPDDIEVTAPLGECEATINDLGMATAADNCGVANVSNNAGSPIYPAGMTTVTWTVIDDAGNTTTCAQTITVLEVEPPSLSCPPDLSVPVDVGSCFATVNAQNAPAASDNCSLNSLISDQAGITTYGLGANVVTWTATDVNGNTATCSYTLNVGYAAPFDLNCPQGVTVDVSGNVISDADNFLTNVVSSPACTNVTLSYAQPTPNAQCGTINFTQTGPASGSAFAVGTQTVTYTAKDEFDNEAVCAVDVTVVEMPTITLTASTGAACPGSTVEISAPVIPNATYTWSGPGGNFANTPTISIPNFGTANEGFYDLMVVSNGCELMSTDMVNLALDINPLAQDDRIEFVSDVAMDSFSVIMNDVQLPVAYGVTVIEPIQGITNLNNGQFAYDGSLASGEYVYEYVVCSDACIDFCDTAEVRLDVVETVCASIPNTISPNGDGVNDEFMIPCLELNEFPDNKLVIYNQWGDVVFKAAPYAYDPADAFKGLYMNNDGEILPDGAYYYIFQPSSTDKSIHGYIQIFR